LLLPFQPFDEMPDVLAAADVLMAILEADAGVFSAPSKVLTYLCAERALLGSMPAGNLSTRTITENEAGLVVEPSDGAGFIRAAERLRQEDALRQECATKGRRYAEREFDILRIADQFEKVIHSTKN
jgi:glycosyltransferase involved in cell wall biosynthesis